jgi:tRNA (adenine22-N1)-methyltransferase
MRLSLRLQTALALCGPVDTLIDIGTDHALLPIGAIEQGLAKQAIAVDNKLGPIEKAITNIKRHHQESNIKTVLADGLEGLDRPIQAAFLLGMGGITIAAILHVSELRFIETLILGPNSEPAVIRGWLESHGWKIIGEAFVVEHGKHYPIIKAVRGTMLLSRLEQEYGPILLNERNPALLSLIRHRLSKLDEARTKTKDSIKAAQLEAEIQPLRRIINERN